MDSTVRLRPNHYDTLGLTSAATAQDIAEAFARELRRTRPFGEISQVGIAHEVLRDPVKRRAYDESLGILPAPEPEPEQPSVQPIAATRQTLFSTPLRTVPQRDRRAPAEPAEERTTGAFIAASLRKPVEERVRAVPAEPPVAVEKVPEPVVVEPPAPVEAKPEPVFPEVPRSFVSQAGPVEFSFPVAEESQIPWKKLGIGAGAMIAAGAILGAWAGPNAEEAVEPASARPGVTMALPEAKPSADALADEAPAPAFAVNALRTRQPARPNVAVAEADALPAPAAGDVTPSPTTRTQTSLAQVEEAIADIPAAQAPETAPVQASLPLPNRVIARTIHQIGYSCGNVSSSTAVDSAAGVFKVTCSSGQSYRAAPVNGRYRFKRWGRQ